MGLEKSVIANPPITFVKNQNTHIGHLFYLSIIDTLARYRSIFLKEEITYPSRCYNLLGAPSENLMSVKGMTKNDFKLFFKSVIKEDWLIRNINLLNKKLVIDDSKKVAMKMKEITSYLNKKGYLIFQGKEIYLNLSKINQRQLKKDIKKNKSISSLLF